MVESADEPPIRGLHSWAKSKAFPFLISPRSAKPNPNNSNRNNTLPQHVGDTEADRPSASTPNSHVHHLQDTEHQSRPVVDKKGNGEKPSTIDQEETKETPPIHHRFVRDVKRIITSSWINWLLIFVPVGIILGAIGDWGEVSVVSPSIIFALNAVAIIPLASLLAFATESVAIRMGDSWGALLNVTFGNAVEIIVFVIGLVANEVRIVQAAALGSILSNLLLILGMCFVFGGLRFREQLYNPSVSQLSACLLSLSVISLLLPTAFHAAFDNDETADRIVLKVSRGTSVVLLLVYILYLLFQLKSHAFMYESTPQHIIDEESHPGVLADMLNNSSSSSDSSSSSSSDSDDTSGSYKTANKIKRALRRKRRKSSGSIKDNASLPPFSRSDTNATTLAETPQIAGDGVFSGDEADREDHRSSRLSSHEAVQSRDFEKESESLKQKKKRKRTRKFKPDTHDLEKTKPEIVEPTDGQPPSIHVGFSNEVQEIPEESSPRRPFHIRQISEAVKPAFNSTVFPHHEATGRSLALPVLRPYDRNATGSMQRASSMPDIHRQTSLQPRAPSPRPQGVTSELPVEVKIEDIMDPNQHLSKTSAVVLLLCTTAMVALCAEFLVGSIDYLVSTSGVKQEFIGLIILPIVGNAAEHVTAVTVAYKNKMDLAINIALGSSIQIALFVTPLMVMLGWAIGAEMSLYFSLFETMSLFASAFIVNYLMIDGRSNYLEGTLLIAAYVIIAIAAFFYPQCGLSAAGGPVDASRAC